MSLLNRLIAPGCRRQPWRRSHFPYVPSSISAFQRKRSTLRFRNLVQLQTTELQTKHTTTGKGRLGRRRKLRILEPLLRRKRFAWSNASGLFGEQEKTVVAAVLELRARRCYVCLACYSFSVVLVGSCSQYLSSSRALRRHDFDLLIGSMIRICYRAWLNIIALLVAAVPRTPVESLARARPLPNIFVHVSQNGADFRARDDLKEARRFREKSARILAHTR